MQRKRNKTIILETKGRDDLIKHKVSLKFIVSNWHKLVVCEDPMTCRVYTWRMLGISFSATVGFSRPLKGKSSALVLFALGMEVFWDMDWLFWTGRPQFYDFWIAIQIICTVFAFILTIMWNWTDTHTFYLTRDYSIALCYDYIDFSLHSCVIYS